MSTKPRLAALPNGPYYLLHDMTPLAVPNLRRQNGDACANVRGIALCRCGGSKNKPFCDGTHSSIGFKSERLTDGKLDRRTSYKGKRITIHDKPAACADGGAGARDLKSVFRMSEEPWIDAGGASAEEIIATIRKCP